MDKNQLYDLAFAYKKTKLWKKLWDNQLFAVRLSNGEIGYCSVMGRNGEHIALAAYVGESGWRSFCTCFDSTANMERMDRLHVTEILLSQDCVSCSFENKDELNPLEISEVRAYCAANGITLRGSHAWPNFTRCRPYYNPWFIQEETDLQWMAEALEAGLEVAKRLETTRAVQLGLEEGAPYDREIPLLVKTADGYDWQKLTLQPRQPVTYPKMGRLYDLSLKRATTAKKRGSIWSCDVFLFPKTVLDEEEEEQDDNEIDSKVPYFPWMQIVVNEDEGLILDSTLCQEDEDYADVFPNKMLDLMAKLGKPQKLLVKTERTAALYQDFAQKVGIRFEVVEYCDGLDDVLADFADQFAFGNDDFDESFTPDIMDKMIELLFHTTDFSSFPDEVIMLLCEMADKMGDELPASRHRLLNEEKHRRFI